MERRASVAGAQPGRSGGYRQRLARQILWSGTENGFHVQGDEPRQCPQRGDTSSLTCVGEGCSGCCVQDGRVGDENSVRESS